MKPRNTLPEIGVCVEAFAVGVLVSAVQGKKEKER